MPLTFAIANTTLPNGAALTAQTGLTGIDDGARVRVTSYDCEFELATTALALEANVVLASSDPARRWIRQATTTTRWATLYAPNVFIDPSAAGNDENDGLTNVTALKTAAELARRVPVLIRPMTINYVGATNPAATDVLSFSPTVQWDRTLSATVPTISIVGVKTAAALPAGANGVFATSTNVVGNVPPQITDTGGAGIVWADGTILEVTSGASNGARSSVMNDEGGGVASVAVWRTAAGTANATPPAPGDTYRVITLTQIPDMFLKGTADYSIKDCQINAWSQVTGSNTGPSLASFNLCKIAWGTFAPLGAGIVINSSYYGGGAVFLVSVASFLNSSGTSYQRKATTQPMRCTSGGRLTLTNGYIQGDGNSHGLAVGGPFAVDGIAGGQCGAFSNFGVRGVGASAAVAVRKGGILNVTGAMWGAGNALQGTQCKEGGRIAVQAAVTPTLASVGQELEIQGAATCATVVAQVPAVAAALVSWANWAAAPFTRNAMDYIAGSVVADAA